MAGSNPSLAVRVTANLEELKKQLQAGGVEIQKTSAQIAKMADSFNGSKLVQQVSQATVAINSLPFGAASLGAKDAARQMDLFERALEKMRLTGQPVPAMIQKTADELRSISEKAKAAEAPVTSLSSQLKGMAGTLGLAFGGAAVVSGLKTLVSSTLDYADSVKTTAAKLGVSMEATQRWKAAADQTGASLDTVSASVMKLSQGIAGSDKSLTSVLAAAGVQMADLKGKKPEEAFNLVAAAISKIEDPMIQARVAMEAYGKSGLDLLPALREGFVGLAKDTAVMSDDTIRRLADAKDAWAKFGSAITIYSGEVISGVMGVASSFLSGWQEAFALIRIASTEGMMPAVAAAMAIDKARNSITELSQRSREYAKAASEAGDSTQEIAAALNLSEKNVQAYLNSLKPAPTTLGDFSGSADAAAQAAQRLREEFQKRVDFWTGAKATNELAELRKEIDAAGGVAKLGSVAYGKLEDRLVSLRDAGAKLDAEFGAIVRTHDLMNTQIPVLANAFAGLQKVMAGGTKLGQPAPLDTFKIDTDPYAIIKQIEQMLIIAGKDTRIKVPAMEAAKTWVDGFHESLGKALQGVGGVIVGAIQGGGSVSKAAFSSIGASLGEDLGQVIAKGIGGSLGKALGSFAGPLGAIAGSLAGGLVDKLFGKNQGRDDAKSFAADFGGFDALRKEMLALEGGGEQLWIALTQNTKGPAQVAATIKAIEEAFKKADEAAAAAGRTMEDTFDGPEGARGFPTREQLQKSAAEAKAAYDYMEASGKYTADVLKQAWSEYEDAAIAAGDGTAKRMKELNAEIISLQKAVELETPEYDKNGVREYGVIEQQNIDRLAALEAEKTAATIANIEREKSAVEVAAAAASLSADRAFEAAKVDAKTLDTYLKDLFKNGYKIPITFQLPSGTAPGAPPSSGGTPTYPGAPPQQTTAKSGPAVVINYPSVRTDQDIKDLALETARVLEKYGYV